MSAILEAIFCNLSGLAYLMMILSMILNAGIISIIFPFAIFGWEVEDITATVTQLSARGIEFLRFSYFQQDPLGIWTAPNGNRVAWFKDPDGNTLSISNHS